MTKAVLSAMIRPLVEPRLPDWVEPLWFTSKEQALEFAPQAEIGWFDLNEKEPMIEIARAATGLKWMNSIYAGLDFMPLDLLADPDDPRDLYGMLMRAAPSATAA